MIDNAATIANMKEAGLSAETILLALSCIVLCSPAVQWVEGHDEQAARRRERDRLRKSAERLRKSAEVQPKEIPPTPPKENTTNLTVVSNNPPIVPPSQDHPRFAEFWDAYPPRDGSNARKPASKAFSAACKRASPQAIIDGLRHFSEAMEARGHIGTPFIPQARTWLNQDRWNETYGTPAVSSKPTIQDGFAKVRAAIGELARREADAFGEVCPQDVVSLPRFRESKP